MKASKGTQSREVIEENATSVRASISFPPNVYEVLGEIAKQKKVSLAWVVRDAAECYIAEKWPPIEKSPS
jgi:hypothetical protein